MADDLVPGDTVDLPASVAQETGVVLDSTEVSLLFADQYDGTTTFVHVETTGSPVVMVIRTEDLRKS